MEAHLAMKGTLSDADVILAEKFAAQCAGGVLIDGQFISTYDAFALNAAYGNPSLDLDFTTQNYNIWGGVSNAY